MFVPCLQDLSYEEYNNWARAHKEAELALVDRDDRIADSAELIETRLELLGATGILLFHSFTYKT